MGQQSAGEQVRIAVVGAGLIGQRHIGHVVREAELAAIVDPAPSAGEIAARHGIAAHERLADMLDAVRPDGVIVATPNSMHVAHGMACIEAGIPVLIEKPLAGDAASAHALVLAAEAAGVPLLVGHHRRHAGLTQSAQRRIANGELGRLVAVQATCWFYKPEGYFETEWRRRKGAGPIVLNLIHDIDLLRFLCGEIVAVQAMDSRAIRGYEVEDSAAIVVAFANGALGSITLTDTVPAPWSWELTAGENPDYPRSGETSYLIGGTEGALSLPNLEFWHYAERKDWWQPLSRTTAPFEREDPFAVQTRHFCDVVRGEAVPLVPGREGLANLRVIEAIKAAADKGARVAIDPMV